MVYFGKNWRSNMVLIGIILFCLLAGACVGIIYHMDTGNDRAELIIEQEIRDQFVQEPDITETVREDQVYVDPMLLRKIDFAGLQEVNADAARWVTIPDTVIDFYVMQEQTLGSYFYLWRDIYQQTSKWGSILTPAEPEDSDDAHLLMFGHNMKDKEVAFGSLRTVYADAEGGEAHPYVYVYYPEYSERWKVWAVCTTEYTDMVYSIPYELDSDDYQDLLDHIQDIAKYELTTAPSSGTRTLVLTTCNGGDSRFFLTCIPDQRYYYEEDRLESAIQMYENDHPEPETENSSILDLFDNTSEEEGLTADDLTSGDYDGYDTMVEWYEEHYGTGSYTTDAATEAEDEADTEVNEDVDESSGETSENTESSEE